MSESEEKFRELLKTLFQFDAGDLDFGIYRIMNYRRKEIESFIEKELVQAVAKAFEAYKTLNAQDLLAKISEKKKEIEKFEQGLDEAILKNGQIEDKFKDKTFAKEYLELKKQLDEVEVTESAQSQVFNDLYNFFSRYYEDGDFISKRRYSSRDTRYAIPYNGEEVKLYWANYDQYYVKTSEVFKDYEFNAKGWRIIFRTSLTEVQAGNNRGDRRFLLATKDSVSVDKENKTCLIKFEYRQLTAEDLGKYKVKTVAGEEKTRGIQQDELNAIQSPMVLQKINAAELKAILSEEQDGKTVLDKHLYKHTRKITSDFFVHKNLKGFLERELDYFIKTEILDIGNLDPRHVTRARVVNDIGRRIIEFLAQIEEFQKRLWEKKKFVLRTDYIITIDRVLEELHPEILKCKAQLKEWQDLGFGRITKKDDLGDKKLPLDTRYFNTEFKEKLLESLTEQGSLDDLIDGTLAKSENWQALNLMLKKYQDSVKCIYIDPPYNTGSDEFIYKDKYQHSSWLAMMDNRIRIASKYIQSDGILFCSIDGHELSNLTDLLKNEFGDNNLLGTIVWKNATDNNPTRIAIEHEYVLCFANDSRSVPPQWKSINSYAKELMMTKFSELKTQALSNNEIQKQFRQFIKDNLSLIGELERYKFVDDNGPYAGSESVHNPHPGGYKYEILHPTTGKPMSMPVNGYRFPEETMRREYVEKGRLIYGRDENRIVKIKLYLSDYLDSLRSVIVLDGRLGSYSLSALFGKGDPVFNNPKAVQLLERLISFSTDRSGLVLDFVAGSGTTAHAVMNLNRQDGGKRKYILVDIGDWFETVLLPRIKKVAFCEKWKDGKPQDGEGTSQIIKYHYLEQYEDSLHNIEFLNEGKGQQILKLFSDTAPEYLMKYMLKYETEGSQSLLNLKQFQSPFEYRLKIISGSRGEETINVDLVETFNYLLGLKIGKYKFLSDDNGRKYVIVFGEGANRRAAVVWRPTKDIDLQKDKEIIESAIGEFNPDQVYVNGDALIKDYKTTETEFKALMGV